MALNERQIELHAEIKMDLLDRKYSRGEMAQEEYDAAVIELERWTQKQYNALKAGV